MACRDTYEKIIKDSIRQNKPKIVDRATHLFFGKDSGFNTTTILQNNLNLFEWGVRNKLFPYFYGRNLTGVNYLTKKEIDFIHRRCCKIAPFYDSSDRKKTKEDGIKLAEKIDIIAIKLGIPAGTAIYLKIGATETITTEFLKSFASSMLLEGYTPAFMANTDAKFAFDSAFSRGIQTDKVVFEKCLIWAISPTITEYNNITTTHLIHPDNWIPYAPSAISRKEIAIWQYGTNCHQIEDNEENKVSFNIDLVRNEYIIRETMF